MDSKTGTLLADVKQEVREKEPKAPGTPPEVKVKTEVNVPEEGVHETVVQTGSEVGDFMIHNNIETVVVFAFRAQKT